MSDESVESPLSSRAVPSSGGIISNLRIVSLGTLLSRVLGLLRDMGMVTVFGAGTILDAFIVAFRLPNLSRQLLGEGALSTAFLPIFIRNRDEHGDETARATLTAVAIVLGSILTVLLALAELAILVALLTYDLSDATRLLLMLLSILLLYMPMICLSALFCAALHALRQFVWPSVVPILLNTVWLAGIGVAVLFGTTLETMACLIAGAVTTAGLFQLALPVWVLSRQNMGLTACWQTGWPHVREVFRSMLPIVVGMSLIQISAIFDSLIAWGLARPEDGSAAWCEAFGIPAVLESGTASALYIGQRMFQFPLGVFGIALGTVLYPVLTQHAQRGELGLLRSDLTRGLKIVIAVALPASAGLFVMAEPLTQVLFRHGRFDQHDSQLTASMIGIYGAGVWSFIGLAIMNRAFYAFGDRMTVVRLGLVALVINLALSLFLVFQIGGIGLAWGAVLTGIVQSLIALALLSRRVGGLHFADLGKTLLKGLAATILMGAGCWALLEWLPVPQTLLSRLIVLLLPCGAGIAMYSLLARALGMTELDELLRRAPIDS